MIVRQSAFAHQAVSHRDAHVIDERSQFLGRIRQNDAPARINNRFSSSGQTTHNLFSRHIVNRRLAKGFCVLRDSVKKRRIHLLGKDIHGHIHQHRSGLAVLGQLKGLFDDFREEFRAIHPPGALHERAIDFVLGAVAMQIDFLMGVFAEVVAGDIAGNYHHGDAVQGGIGDAGGRVGHPGPQMAHDHGSLAGDTRIAIGRMGGNLFVPHIDEVDGAIFQGRQYGDIRVPAQTEDVFNAAVFQILHQLMGYEIFHMRSSLRMSFQKFGAKAFPLAPEFNTARITARVRRASSPLVRGVSSPRMTAQKCSICRVRGSCSWTGISSVWMGYSQPILGGEA